jgi:hypothetical protein
MLFVLKIKEVLLVVPKKSLPEGVLPFTRHQFWLCAFTCMLIKLILNVRRLLANWGEGIKRVLILLMLE